MPDNRTPHCTIFDRNRRALGDRDRVSSHCSRNMQALCCFVFTSQSNRTRFCQNAFSSRRLFRFLLSWPALIIFPVSFGWSFFCWHHVSHFFRRRKAVLMIAGETSSRKCIKCVQQFPYRSPLHGERERKLTQNTYFIVVLLNRQLVHCSQSIGNNCCGFLLKSK